MKKVLITDSIDPRCVGMLTQQGIAADVLLKKTSAELKEVLPEYHGWIIRSGTQITADLIEAAGNMQVIGRAGVGVDNIDLDAATRKGILVVNAPDGNTISTAEHTCAMIMAASRLIPQANRSLVMGKWERKDFTGSELFGKTLGIVGIGKIGRAVAERMKGYGMTLLGFDPVLGREAAERIGVELVSLDEIYRRSDIITVHTPLTAETKGMLNRKTLAKCKQGVKLINCARGGIIDEADLLEALNSGHVSAAALDVFTHEPPGDSLRPLIEHPHVIATPHIAASTEEAQEKVAEQITEQVIDALVGRPVISPVNAMAIRMASQTEAQPYLRLADKLGQVAGQLVDGSLQQVTVGCYGELARKYAEVITVSALRGVLSRWKSEPVNLINAPVMAKEIGLHVEEQRHLSAGGNFLNLVEVKLSTDTGDRTVGGAIFGSGDPRLVRVDNFDFEVRPEGHILFYMNEDRPGMLASVGGILAEAGINIAALALGRKGPGLMALTAVSVDEEIPKTVMQKIAEIDGVRDVKVAKL